MLPRLQLVLLVGQYAQHWHLQSQEKLTATVAAWRQISNRLETPRYLPLPHPSWRNNAWLKQHQWFEAELLPQLRVEVRALLSSDS